jgi:hypothetical protein
MVNSYIDWNLPIYWWQKDRKESNLLNSDIWYNCTASTVDGLHSSGTVLYISLNSEYLAHLLGLVQRIHTIAPGSSTLLRNGSSTGRARLLSFLVVVQESLEIHDLRIMKGKQTRQRTSRGLFERQADSATYFPWTLLSSPKHSIANVRGEAHYSNDRNFCW